MLPGSLPTSAMSSANLKRQVTAVCKFIWLVYIENNMGKRTHPWGAPELSTTSSDRYPFTQTCCGRSRRKSLIHSTRFELTCKSISLLVTACFEYLPKWSQRVLCINRFGHSVFWISTDGSQRVLNIYRSGYSLFWIATKWLQCVLNSYRHGHSVFWIATGMVTACFG